MDGGTLVLPAQVRSTIQFIKEIVKNHSDVDIYAALKESSMDPNEAIQKLLYQDPFHEVKRKRDRRKEGLAPKDSEDQKKHTQNVSQGINPPTRFDFNARRGGYYRSAAPSNAAYGCKYISRKTGPSMSKEFRVVRDNRVNHNADQEVNSGPPQQLQSSTQINLSTSDRELAGNSTGTKPFGGSAYAHVSNAPVFSRNRQSSHPNTSGDSGKEVLKVSTTDSQAQNMKPTSQDPATFLPSSSTVGLYSSSMDPVHVPSPDSRTSSAVGAIKRDVGVVGVRRQSYKDPAKHTSEPSASSSMQFKTAYSPSESLRSFSAVPKTDQLAQVSCTQSFSSTVGSREFTNYKHNAKPNHQVQVHQKASQIVKKWKPKSSNKPDVSNPRVTGIPAKIAASSEDSSKEADPEVSKLQDKLSQANIHETQNVVIAQHIRVPDTDRCQLTFGSFNFECNSSRDFLPGGVRDDINGDVTTTLSVSEPLSSEVYPSLNKQVDVEDPVIESRTDSPASPSSFDNQLSGKKDPLSLDSYKEIELVKDIQSYAPSNLQKHQDPPELPSFSAYDVQSGYDIPYLRTTMEGVARAQGLQFIQEGLNSHAPDNIPASSALSMEQHYQQQLLHHVAQMYPQMHLSHFAPLMPYRQFIQPGVYVPPMAMPGYSSNAAAFPHPSGGNGYVIMPGGGTSSGLKYGIQQFKSVPTGSQTGFGNFASPTGYAVNPGVVGSGSGTGLDDSSRMKYKDGNLYISNQQGDPSEIWIPNLREIPGMQSPQYYSMTGQTPHAAAYFNAPGAAAVAQSSHVQFPGGLYPPQPGAIPNPHQLGGNVGVAAAGTYQQPQFNWTTNF